MREINIQHLEIFFTSIIRKLKAENVSKVMIDTDLYNKIPANNWSIYNKPEEVMVIGSLFDDLDNLEKLITDNTRPFTYVDFDRVAAILNIISEKQNPIGK